MRYLVDTNIFLFAMREIDKLQKDVLDIITDYENKNTIYTLLRTSPY